EYFPMPEWDDQVTIAEMPAGLDFQPTREAYRALKGSPLRQEVYALDDSDKEAIPYSITATAYTVKRIQDMPSDTLPGMAPAHAVFLNLQQQSIVFSLERDAGDPHVMQQITLETDRYGNVLQSAQVAYGRKPGAIPVGTPAIVQTEQERMHITCSENQYTNDVVDDDLHYRLRLPFAAKSYELTGYTVPATETAPNVFKALLWKPEDLKTVVLAASEIDFAATPNNTTLQKRLLGHSRSLFRYNDAQEPLPFGSLQSLAIPHESYSRAHTTDTLTHCYGEFVTEADLQAAGYVEIEPGQGFHWLPSGTVKYSTNPKLDFFSPFQFIDPWYDGNGATLLTTVSYTGNHLLPKTVTDTLGNTSSVEAYDWRTLQPLEMKDANNNISRILYDALGMPVAMAVMGKGT
ncbi:MAG: hypothetical protein EOP50_17205, partial [Sphingobacteriales bacterium]